MQLVPLGQQVRRRIRLTMCGTWNKKVNGLHKLANIRGEFVFLGISIA